MTSTRDLAFFVGRQKALLALADTCQRYGDYETSDDFWKAMPRVLAALGVLIETVSVEDNTGIGDRAVAEFCKFFHMPVPDQEEIRREHEKVLSDFEEVFGEQTPEDSGVARQEPAPTKRLKKGTTFGEYRARAARRERHDDQ